MSLTAFQTIDPDTIYEKSGENSTTFFYIPNTGKIYTAPYPNSHRDMLTDNDQISKELDVAKPTGFLWNREHVVAKSIMGRIGMWKGHLVIALWNSLKTPGITNFLDKLVKTNPNFNGLADRIVLVGADKSPQFLSDFIQKSGNAALPSVKKKENKVYQIGNKTYLLSDLQKLRSALHTGKYEGLGVLCHPDMAKYPEIKGYIPTQCQATPAKSLIRNRIKQHDPYAFSYGETFSEWLKNLEQLGLG